MDNYSIYSDIEDRLKYLNEFTQTPEGNLIVGIICQRIKDAMGILDADRERVYLPREGKAWVNQRYVKQRSATHQEIAIKWFRDKEHFPLADLVDIEPTHINWLLKTKAGVKL